MSHFQRPKVAWFRYTLFLLVRFLHTVPQVRKHWNSHGQNLYTGSVQIHMCTNKKDVYKSTQNLVVEVFCYAYRDTGFEFFWTDAESHPQLTTCSFVCCTLTTLT